MIITMQAVLKKVNECRKFTFANTAGRRYMWLCPDSYRDAYSSTFLLNYKCQQSLRFNRNGKGFAAYEIVNRLKTNSENELLSLLSTFFFEGSPQMNH
jgi:hypothetical protein